MVLDDFELGTLMDEIELPSSCNVPSSEILPQQSVVDAVIGKHLVNYINLAALIYCIFLDGVELEFIPEVVETSQLQPIASLPVGIVAALDQEREEVRVEGNIVQRKSTRPRVQRKRFE